MYKDRWDEALDWLVKEEIFPQKIHRINLYGPPGTGKSTYAFHRFNPKHVLRESIHEDMKPYELFGNWTIEDNTTKWVDLGATLALKHGFILVLDEIDKANAQMQSALHKLLDDKEIAEVALPTGEVVRPNQDRKPGTPGFGVILTSNQVPTVLSEPLLDRIDLNLVADTLARGAVEAFKDKAIAELAENLYTNKSKAESNKWYFTPQQSGRNLVVLEKLSEAMSLADAAQYVYGDLGEDVQSAIEVIKHGPANT